MELDKTKVQDLFIAGSVNPALCMLFRKAAGMPGLLIYLYVRWRKSFPHYMTKQTKKRVDKYKNLEDLEARINIIKDLLK